MAKGNLFLGFASGKIGSVVMYRSKGAQVSRALNPSPSNPQSALQMLQRVTLKTASSAYSLLQDITNHAFEGYATGTDSQGAFVTRNIAQMRAQLADYINSGDADEILGCIEANFNGKADTWPAMRPYIVSAGRAPQVPYKLQNTTTNSMALAIDYVFTSSPSYDDVINALGLQRGDQLTFLFLSVDDTDTTYTYNGFHFARIILEPANGDFTTPFTAGGKISSPNPRNKGRIFVYSIPLEDEDMVLGFDAGDEDGYIISPGAGVANSLGAAAIIVSRQVGDTWQRSNTQLIVRSSVQSVAGHLTWDHETGYLADAIASYLKAGAVSTEYLNQAQKVTATKE